MKSFNECVDAYRQLVEEGTVKKAYAGLMEFIMSLRNHLKSKYPDYHVSGSIYYGYMDMTYFSFTPQLLRSKNLKIAIAFIHEKASFEVWLAGANKQIQSKYWKLFKEKTWASYRIPESLKGIDSIIEYDLSDLSDFNDLGALTEQIEKRTLQFIADIEAFFATSKV